MMYEKTESSCSDEHEIKIYKKGYEIQRKLTECEFEEKRADSINDF